MSRQFGSVPEAWNVSLSAYPRHATVHALFAEQAARCPHAVAVSDGEQELTYAELDRLSGEWAWRLISHGIEPESAVAIVMRRSAPMIVAMLAVLKAGGAYVPLDGGYPPQRLAWMLRDAGVRLALTDESNRGRLDHTGVPALVAGAALHGSEGGQLPLTGPLSRAYVMYTSGSTGVPKGVEVVHRGIVRLVRNTNYVAFAGCDVVAQVANPAFDAITFEVWGALLNGARLVILPTETVLSPRSFAEALAGHGVTTMFLTSSLFSVMAATVPHAFGGLRTLVVGGDAVNPEAARSVLASAPPLRLVNGYGPTECTTFSVCHLIEAVPAGARSIPIGRPISNSEAYILDEQLTPVAAGVAGDLYLGGDGLARGYLNRPDLTRERFLAHPFDPDPAARLYKTGDRARFREDGAIEFLGRLDHQVKFHGFRIELSEIEIALRKHAGVIDAVATVWQRAENDERLVAYVAAAGREGTSRSTLDEAQLRRFLEQDLPGYMIPSHIVVLTALPLNAVGKVDRAALPEPMLNRATLEGATPLQPDAYSSAAYTSVTERAIAQIWQDVLQTGAIDPEANFFDVGGTSLTLALVESRLRGYTGKPFRTTDLFRYPSVRSLARHLDGCAAGPLAETGRQRGNRQRAAFEAPRLNGRG